MDIMKEIDRRIVFWDGGMGSLLQERGLQPGELPETWNILHPDIVTEIHREYIEAGKDQSGKGFDPRKLLAPGADAIKATVKEKMELFGSVGKA